MGNTNPGGGAIVLTVGGCLTLNGSANAGSGVVGGFHVGGAGAINITAGSLVGSGGISANGGSGSGAKSRGAGGGGRVAVRLTDAGATLADFSGTIAARGDNANSATPDYGSSAGTVYLQGGGAGEGAGTIRVANVASSTAAGAKTGFPSLSGGLAIDDLSRATLEIANSSRVVLVAGAKVSALSIASGSSLDLDGKRLVVERASVGGTRLPPGTYTASSGAVAGLVVDSGGGELVVAGRGTAIIVR